MKDLFHYVNGAWIEKHEIPADRSIDGTFHALRDRAEADVHELLEASDGRPGKLYDAYMDVDAIEAAGMTPLDEDLDKLTVENIDALATALGELDRLGVSAPLAFWVTRDSGGGSDIAVPYLVQSGLGLPDEAYYREEAHAETLKAYRTHVAEMLALLDASRLQGLRPEDAAERIVNLETEIAAGHWDVVQTRDAVKTYNPTSIEELPAIIRRLLAGAGLDHGAAIAMMPSYIEHLAGLLRQDRLSDWQLWGTWHILHARANLLPPAVGAKDFEFYGTRLAGTPQQRDRWKRAVSLCESLIGHEVGVLFSQKHFPESSKQEMLVLVDHLIEAYRERISNLSWMSEATRQRALEKLGTFKAKIGYPDNPRTYEGLVIKGDLMEDVRNACANLHDYELAKIGNPDDRDEWLMTAQTVNACYNPMVNDITFPAAILRPPFYDPQADLAENYGAIGAVIGHEIGHGFDDQGSRYDGQGNLNSWWEDSDREAFTKLTDKLAEQFDGLVPTVLQENGIESKGVNGQFTLGENIGDLGGLGIAVIAYRNHLAEQGIDLADAPTAHFEAEDFPGGDFTGLQRLFLAWARVWRCKVRPELVAQLLAIDPHSPNEFRCNIIAQNIKEFYEAFPEVTEDSPMWLDPKDRVEIW